jgi:hypothetical protein
LNIQRAQPTLVDPIDFSIDVITTVLAFGVGFYAFRIRATFKGGLLWQAWRIIGPSALVYGLSKVTGLVEDLSGYPLLPYLQSVLELLFVLALAYGFYLFHKAWNPKEAPKK